MQRPTARCSRTGADGRSQRAVGGGRPARHRARRLPHLLLELAAAAHVQGVLEPDVLAGVVAAQAVQGRLQAILRVRGRLTGQRLKERQCLRLARLRQRDRRQPDVAGSDGDPAEAGFMGCAYLSRHSEIIAEVRVL
ncbi:MAG: hypothetical protein R2844_16410 [Caldilineales bacterium]